VPRGVTGRTCARTRLGMLALLDRAANAETERERERERQRERERERKLKRKCTYAGVPRRGKEEDEARGEEKKRPRGGERERERKREKRGQAARCTAGRAVSCRQIYRVARADPERRVVLYFSVLLGFLGEQQQQQQQALCSARGQKVAAGSPPARGPSSSTLS